VSRRICLFGGSFNPPHVGHVMATAWALSTLPIDALWWVPTWKHAFGKDLAPWDARLAMARAAVTPFGDAVRVSDIEGELGGESRTIDTVLALETRHPDVRWSLLIGADLVPELPRWKRWSDLQARVDVHVLGRAGYGDPGAHHAVTLPDINSSAVRASAAAGRRDDLVPRVPRGVLDEIERRGLYR